MDLDPIFIIKSRKAVPNMKALKVIKQFSKKNATKYDIDEIQQLSRVPDEIIEKLELMTAAIDEQNKNATNIIVDHGKTIKETSHKEKGNMEIKVKLPNHQKVNFETSETAPEEIPKKKRKKG